MGIDKKRESNIELLRILAIMGVVLLHYVNPSIGGGLTYSAGHPINNTIMYLVRSMAVCAVDLFMLISGYFMCHSAKGTLWKPIRLVVQVVVFNEGLYLLSAFVSGNFSVRSFLANLLPCNYFVILYCVVYLLSPYMVAFMDCLGERNLKRFVLILLLVFSVEPTLVDVVSTATGAELTGLNMIGAYGDQSGYNIVNFLLCWMVGASIRRCKAHIRTSYCLLGYIASTAAIFGTTQLFLALELSSSVASSYCNPLIILEAVFIFMAFNNCNMGSVKIVNKLAGGAFSVFLLHSVFINRIGIEKYATSSPVVLVLHMVGSVVIIYLICWAVGTLYGWIMSPIYKAAERTIKLPEIGLIEK